MNKVGSTSPNADFERFVYADVATEPNGMELSVLSALSRRGLDPWQEAQRRNFPRLRRLTAWPRSFAHYLPFRHCA